MEKHLDRSVKPDPHPFGSFEKKKIIKEKLSTLKKQEKNPREKMILGRPKTEEIPKSQLKKNLDYKYNSPKKKLFVESNGPNTPQTVPLNHNNQENEIKEGEEEETGESDVTLPKNSERYQKVNNMNRITNQNSEEKCKKIIF